jgi:plasmid stability protein
MPTVTFKNIPDDLYEELKQSAQINHRSVNSELIICLEKVFRPKQVSATALIEKARELRRRVNSTELDISDIHQAKTQGRE